MSASSRTSALLRHRYRAAQVFVLGVGVGAYGVGLKLDRIRVQSEAPVDVWPVVQASSDLAFGVAWLLLWMMAYFAPRSERIRTINFVLAHVFSLVLVLLTFANNEYSLRSGSSLSWAHIQLVISDAGELQGVLGSQMTPDAVARLMLGLALVLVVPWMTAPLAHRLLDKPRTRTMTEFMRTSRPWQTTASLATVLAVGLATWSAPTASAQFSRAPLLNLLLGPIQQARAFPASLTHASFPAPVDTEISGSGLPYNVVIITLESQRATELLPKTQVPVTPVLDALRSTSLTATQAYAVVPHTSKALTAIQCGIEPPFDHQNSEADPNGMAVACLPELLAAQGYKTAFFQSATQQFERRPQLVSNLGFQHFQAIDTMRTAGFSRANYFGYEDDVMLQPSADWVESLDDEPFLLTYLTVAAHHDYLLPDIPTIDFVDDPLENAYLNGVHYQDQFVGHVLQQFRDLELYDNTIFVIVGDHGEGFGEHGVFQHDSTIYEEGLRVPLVVHAPGLIDPSTYSQPIQQATIVPTVLDLLGYTVDTDSLSEQSLLAPPDGSAVNATCLDKGKCVARVVDGMKYIHFFGDRRDRVYNLANDPFERTDLVLETSQEWIDSQRDAVIYWWLANEHRYTTVRNPTAATATSKPVP